MEIEKIKKVIELDDKRHIYSKEYDDLYECKVGLGFFTTEDYSYEYSSKLNEKYRKELDILKGKFLAALSKKIDEINKELEEL